MWFWSQLLVNDKPSREDGMSSNGPQLRVLLVKIVKSEEDGNEYQFIYPLHAKEPPQGPITEPIC